MTTPQAGSQVMLSKTTMFPDGSQQIEIFDTTNYYLLPFLEKLLGEPVSVVLLGREQTKAAETAMGTYPIIKKESVQ